MRTVTITCKGCGEVISGADEDQLVEAVQAHIAQAHPHGHNPSREQVLAIIRKRGVDES